MLINCSYSCKLNLLHVVLNYTKNSTTSTQLKANTIWLTLVSNKHTLLVLPFNNTVISTREFSGRRTIFLLHRSGLRVSYRTTLLRLGGLVHLLRVPLRWMLALRSELKSVPHLIFNFPLLAFDRIKLHSSVDKKVNISKSICKVIVQFQDSPSHYITNSVSDY